MTTIFSRPMSQPQPQRADDYAQFVPFTARMMAAMRARESNRSDRLFNDHLAARLAGEEAFAKVNQQLTPQDQAYVAVRTRFFDDFLTQNSTQQIVLLAAGLDARAYRLAWQSQVTLYELDQPEVMDYKAAILADQQPTCTYHPIATDLTQPWADTLLAAGYNPQQPGVWLIEGLLMYLFAPQVDGLLTTVSELAAAGSYLGADFVNEKGVDYEPYRGYFHFGCDYPETLLANHGWGATVIQPGEPGANFDRYPAAPPPRSKNVQATSEEIPRVFLVKAVKEG